MDLKTVNKNLLSIIRKKDEYIFKLKEKLKMNEYKLYAICDKLVGTFGEPFLSNNDAVAIRRFQYIMSKSEMVSRDCALYCLGCYNLDTGAILPKVTFITNFEVKVDEEK